MRSTITLALLLGACEAAGPAETPATRALAAPTAATAPAPDHLSSDRIYYDLTRFDWYAQGEPLVHADQPYQPFGMPLAAPLSEMERAGEYRGVEYYRRGGDDASLYIPVFDGYWLAFRASHAAATAD